MESLERCLHQIFRPKENYPSIKGERYGDCSKCKYNPIENPKCKGYSPITFNTFEVKEKKED